MNSTTWLRRFRRVVVVVLASVLLPLGIAYGASFDKGYNNYNWQPYCSFRYDAYIETTASNWPHQRMTQLHASCTTYEHYFRFYEVGAGYTYDGPWNGTGIHNKPYNVFSIWDGWTGRFRAYEGHPHYKWSGYAYDYVFD